MTLSWKTALGGLLLCAAPCGAVNRISFDSIPLAPGAYWNGSDGSGGFTESGAHFNNAYDAGFGSWSGFAVSRVDDPSTPGYGNQYAVFGSGKGYGGDGNYAVAYDSAWDEQDIITLAAAALVQGFYINNTAYAALDMLGGSAFSKKFGGTSGADPDWFMLTVTGRDGAGQETGSAAVYLADYRSADPQADYILSDWTWVDLAGLGASVRTLHFQLSSSDHGAFGMNTPAYFALDQLTYTAVVPEAGTGSLAVAGVAVLAWRRMRRRRAAEG